MSPPLKHDPTVCSYKTQVIGGIKVSLFNMAKLPLASTSNPKDVAVLYILHGRKNSNKFSESVAFRVQEIYRDTRNKSTLPLICVSFDIRNHGERLIDPLRNDGWNSGNTTHAMDMCSFIDGSVQDCKLIMDYMPLLYPGYNFRNYLTGSSLGGHTCFRFATQFPKSVELIIPVIGCTDLCSLLINRLKGNSLEHSQKGLRKLAYEDLQLTLEQQQLWPEYFHNYVSKQDFQIAENFPNHVKVFALFGELDTLVPPMYAQEWVAEMESLRCYDGSVTQYLYKNVGHESTDGMCDLYAHWLVGNISAY